MSGPEKKGEVGLLNNNINNVSLSDSTESEPGFVFGGKFFIFIVAV